MNKLSVAAWSAFRARVEELGGTILEPDWLGKDRPHRVRCAAGRACNPRPGNVRNGKGICRTCAGQSPGAAWNAFRSGVEELGGTILEPAWLGKDQPHRVRCAAGHEGTSLPSSVRDGHGICLRCVRKDPDSAERSFRARVEELGGTVVGPYVRSLDPVWVRCSAGHDAYPRPAAIQGGQGLCRACAGKVWDAFYIVSCTATDTIKFGITSGDPRPRLAHHAREGFTDVVRLYSGLPGAVALRLESELKNLFGLAGVRPVRGREYVPGSARNVLTAVVDDWLTDPLL